MCERSCRGRSSARAGTASAVPMIASCRQAKSLAPRGAPERSTPDNAITNSLRCSGLPCVAAASSVRPFKGA